VSAADQETRVQLYPAGLVPGTLSQIERRVPADEPPPLPANAELAWIGKPVARYEGRAKVTGATRFTVDIHLPGMLHGRLLRSPHAHARLLSLDVLPAAALPQVRAALAVNEAAGRPVEAPPPPDAGPLARARRVLYAGDIVAAVAADTPAAAGRALAAIRAEYQPLPFVVDLERASASDAPLVYERPVRGENYAGAIPGGEAPPQNGNVRGPSTAGSRGDARAGLAQADLVIDGEYRTQVQTHCCLETHAVIADWRDDGLTVYLSTQYTAGVRAELARAYELPLQRVRVVVEATGGGFGSKSSAGPYVRAAVALSRAARAPVRVVLDRHEEQVDSGNRPATLQRLRIGAKRDGSLTAIDLEAWGTAGVALGAGVGFIAQSLYRCDNFAIAQSDVFINAGPGCAMRAPGNVPGAFALEQAVDELAGRLGLDPLELRDRIDPSPVRRAERRLGAERFGWRPRAPGADASPVKRGVGMAQSLWAAGVQTNASCEVRIHRDGSVEVLSGVQDIGTGIRTVLAQVVGETLGLRPADIDVRIGDTDFPAGPPSYGSMTTASLSPAARNAAHRALLELRRLTAGQTGRLSFRESCARLPVDRVSAVASRSEDYGGFARRSGDMAQAQTTLGGVQFAQVAVDTETGAVRVERVVAAQDCGRPINPRQVESQVHGGILMGLSYALYEERVIDRHTGHVLNADLEHYKIARAGEIPSIDVVLLEHYRGTSSTDAYGIAEPSNIATTPAIANAIYNAIGVRLRHLPMTPAAVLAALGRVPGGRPA